MRVFCVLLCFSLCTDFGFSQFGFFQQRDDRRFSPFQFAQNLLQNPNRVREGLQNFLHVNQPIANDQYRRNQGGQEYDQYRPNQVGQDNQYRPNQGNQDYDQYRPNQVGQDNQYRPNQGNQDYDQYRPNQGDQSNDYRPNQGGQNFNQYQPNQGGQDLNQYQPNQPGLDNQYRPNQGNQDYDQYRPTQDGMYETKPVVFPTSSETIDRESQDGSQDYPNPTPIMFPVNKGDKNTDRSDETEPNQNGGEVTNSEAPFVNNPTQESGTLAPLQPQTEGLPTEPTIETTLPPLTPVPPTIVSRNVNFGSAGIFNDPCQTVENEIGSCINILQCKPYIKIVQEFKSNPAAAVLLRKAHCGFENSNPKVCCPLPGFPTVEPSTTTTTTVAPTTTTKASVPSGKSVDGDFVAAFPEPPVCGVSNATFSRVVGGIDAKLGDLPWMAVLGFKPRRSNGVRWLCGGSIITSRHILTAAHCIHNHEDDLFLVRVGELDLARDDEGATPVDILIKTKIKHEKYDPTSFENDIGVLVLEKDITFTELIQPICMPKETELRSLNFENYNPIIAGWGDLQYRGPTATHLQVLQLPVVSNEFCAQAYSQYKNHKVDERVLCAGFKKGGKDTCQGDSGGPLMQPIWNSKTYKTYFYQIGVVSFGKKCAEPGFPGIYSRVTNFIPWIQEKVLGHA